MVTSCKNCGAAISYFKGEKKPVFCSELCERVSSSEKLNIGETVRLLSDYNRKHCTSLTYGQAAAKGII